jgi:hypothetical protein
MTAAGPSTEADSLTQEIEASQLYRPPLEDVDERRADDLPLLLRVGHARQSLEEQVRGVDEIKRQVHLLGEPRTNLAGFVIPEQSVVDEDTGESIPDRAMNQQRGDRRIDAARQPAHHLAASHMPADAFRRLLDERRNRPVARATTYVEGKVAENVAAMVRMHDLGVKQEGI